MISFCVSVRIRGLLANIRWNSIGNMLTICSFLRCLLETELFLFYFSPYVKISGGVEKKLRVKIYQLVSRLDIAYHTWPSLIY